MFEPIQIVHFSDLHFGSGERHGSINPETGLNKRFEDFMSAMDKCINFSIENNIDLVIFTGDTFKHATPEPIYQREFARRIKKLSLNKIPTVLLIGNHDILYRIDGSDALDIYNTLEVDYVTVFSKIELKKIKTKSGDVEIISLPHITKSRLLTKEEYRNLDAKKQDDLMIEKVKHSIEACVEKLDKSLPAVLIGHGTIETAQFGSEQDLSIGKVFSYPLKLFLRNELEYVGFGHIHKHQVLNPSSPIVLYAGSLERVDFGEENEDKGFIYLKLEKNNSKFEFKSVSPRKFLTISCDLRKSENPQSDLEAKIKLENIHDAIVRIRYKILENDVDKINSHEIKKLLEKSFSFYIYPEIEKEERTFRLGEIDSSVSINPMVTLEKYLHEYGEEEKTELIKKAKELFN